MQNTTYNGWTNYATWRVNLEIFDCLTLDDIGCNADDDYIVGKVIRAYAEDIIEQTATGLALDYAMAFLSDVDWQEIAVHMIAEQERA
jgi:hypothetical protein